ncbi:hypothetical protein EVAR_92568_1 [Eumeta japonica]|uniref:Uncharacterized protein n=1 Tax=Eumeta variegata TaxID=151549 RepID=A0A4C1SX92_EUMVA|nr:hypothetical protein EVAR_92568_1 [Eumeta japonica]
MTEFFPGGHEAKAVARARRGGPRLMTADFVAFYGPSNEPLSCGMLVVYDAIVLTKNKLKVPNGGRRRPGPTRAARPRTRLRMRPTHLLFDDHLIVAESSNVNEVSAAAPCSDVSAKVVARVGRFRRFMRPRPRPLIGASFASRRPRFDPNRQNSQVLKTPIPLCPRTARQDSRNP